MGWFSISALVGFLLFWSWRYHTNRAATETGNSFTKFNSFVASNAHYVLIDFLPSVLAALLIFGTVLFFLGKMSVTVDAFVFGFAEDIRRGYITRSVIGLILGFGVAYVLEQRSRAGERQNDKPSSAKTNGRPSVGSMPSVFTLPEHAKAGEDAESPLGSLARLSSSALLSIGVGMLALVSPHLDSWLNHITNIKLPYGELTVATNTAHRTINSDALFYLADALSVHHRRYKLRLVSPRYRQLARLPPPGEHLLGCKPVSSGYVGNHRAWCQRLLNNPGLVVLGEPTASSGLRDHFQPARHSVRLKRKHRHEPIPSKRS